MPEDSTATNFGSRVTLTFADFLLSPSNAILTHPGSPNLQTREVIFLLIYIVLDNFVTIGFISAVLTLPRLFVNSLSSVVTFTFSFLNSSILH